MTQQTNALTEDFGEKSKPHTQTMTQTASRLLLPLVIATPLIAGLGLYINRQLSEEIRQETYRTLTIIAEQKRQQIESKLDEARGDAELFFRGPALLPTLLDEWLRSGRKDAVLLNRMHDRLEQIVQARGWLGVAVYGTDNRPVVSVGTTGLRPRPESIQSGPRPAQVEFLDLSRNAAGEAVYGLLAPVSLPDRKAVGVALPEWSAEQTLYPLVEAWPAPTLSAETFLVRLEGEEVFYLTPLRHEADAAMTKRESIHRAGLPAALAALGERGILADARDYRGVPVLAYATAIAGTPWLMIAKIDQDEAQAGLRRVAWITTLVTGMTLLLLYGAGYLLWRRERQRRELEELTARKAVEARFRVIFEQAPLGVALIDSLSGRILEVNPRFAEIAGRNQEELTRLDWMSITHPEDVPADRDNMARLNAGLIPGFRMEKRYLKPDGGVVWINMTIAPLASEPGRPSRHLCMIEDITERRAEQESLIQAREQLARADSDRQFRILFAQSLDGILILTDDQRILDANSAALDLLGYPPDELRLLRLSDILADAEQPRLTQSPPVMMAGMPHHEEWLYRRKDGSTFLGEVTAKRLVEGRYFARFQDVTERRRLEKQETIRLETLSLLASGASLPNILESLVRVIESSHAGLLCSILLLDQEGTHLLTGAAPSLPDFYNRAIHGLAIGPAEGSCGAAAFTGQRVIVEDIQTHPNWVNFRQLAARAGLGACWSEPIRSATGQVCGTFAIYHRHPSRPSPADLQLIEQAANLAAIAVDRTRAIEALSASEERYRLLAENANDIIWTMDLQGGFVYMSPAVEKYLGYSPAEAIQLTLDQLLTPTSAESVRRELARVFAAIQTGQGGTEISQELHAQCKDGSKVWIDVATTVMRNPQGEVVGIVGVARDITARKFTEIRLSESEQRFRSLFEHLPIAYQSLDVTGRWLDANQRMAELLGFGSPTEMLGKDFGDYWQDAARAAFPGKFEEFKRTHTVDGELLLRRVDGRPISVLIAGKIERDAKGRFIRTHCILTDITERRALEDRISDLNATLEEKVVQLAAANAAKSQFMGHMSHELRTPMNAILGFAQLLEYLVPEPDHRDLVRMIRESGDHLLRIIDDILDLAKIEAGQLRINTQAFSLPSVLERVDHMLRIQANAKGLEFRVEPPPTPIGALLGDPGRLQQILVNLVGNALKFTEQGQVSLIVAPAAAAAPARLRLRFEVRDTGIGIPPEVLETLFQPFSQGDASLTRRFGGTGLGLVISQRLVEGMGGEMGVQSVVGQGSTFWFEIPFQRVEADPADEANAAEPAAEQRPLAGLRVLAVDDNPINLRMIGRVLEQQGANVAQARDGQAALHVLRSRPGDFDVVLMDVQMPVMNGLEATRAIRGDVALATLPVIALTAGVLPEERAAALDAGMNDFLAKPLNLSQLLAALKPYLSRAGQ